MSFQCVAERVLVLRYFPGDRFPLHTDTPYALSQSLHSAYTLIIYLNDDFQGGRTYFPDLEATVSPRKGSALIFAHDLRHEGLAVQAGTKYAIHGFVMYGY